MSEARLALVCGASSGIGRATALALAARGMTVVGGARAVVPVVGDGSERIEAVVLDVMSDVSVHDVVEAIVEHHGRIDVLVNSVGSAPAGTFDAVPSDDWLSALDGKLLGAVRTMQAVLPHMMRQGFGRIVNVAGSAGKEPDEWMVVSGAANAAMLTLTNAAARQLAVHGITVNAVCPGPTATRRWAGLVAGYARISGATDAAAAEARLRSTIPDGRPATADEIAAYVGFLASDEAAHITGTALAIDGGQSRGI